jgi:hypothetical protein
VVRQRVSLGNRCLKCTFLLCLVRPGYRLFMHGSAAWCMSTVGIWIEMS